MTGAFKLINNNERYREYNIVKDIESAQKVTDDWPTPIVWSGVEIGISATFPGQIIQQDLVEPARHPVREAYEQYTDHKPPWSTDMGFNLGPSGRLS